MYKLNKNEININAFIKNNIKYNDTFSLGHNPQHHPRKKVLVLFASIMWLCLTTDRTNLTKMRPNVTSLHQHGLTSQAQCQTP